MVDIYLNNNACTLCPVSGVLDQPFPNDSEPHGVNNFAKLSQLSAQDICRWRQSALERGTEKLQCFSQPTSLIALWKKI